MELLQRIGANQIRLGQPAIIWLAAKLDLRDYLIIFGRNIDSIAAVESTTKSRTSSQENAG